MEARISRRGCECQLFHDFKIDEVSVDDLLESSSSLVMREEGVLGRPKTIAGLEELGPKYTFMNYG